MISDTLPLGRPNTVLPRVMQNSGINIVQIIDMKSYLQLRVALRKVQRMLVSHSQELQNIEEYKYLMM
jgi:hypothetical protein